MIRLDDVTFSYGREAVLSRVSLHVEEGESVVVVGANGSGKSTLLRIVNGLAFPTMGQYFFDGERLDENRMADPVFARQFHLRVGYVFQSAETQLFGRSVEEEVAYGPVQMGLPSSEVARRVVDALSLFGLGRVQRRPPYTLSGGEKKRVALAAVYAMDPEVWTLDEPFLGLDRAGEDALVELLGALKQGGKTFLIVARGRGKETALADRVVKLNRYHELETSYLLR